MRTIPRLVSRAAAAIACLLQCGCSGSASDPDATPGAGPIPLKVWYVLHSGDILGNRMNRGCRLTVEEMIAFVERLKSTSDVFGPGVQFAWNPDVDMDQVSLQQGATPTSPRTISTDFITQHIAMNLGMWDPGVVNIYFVGDAQHTSPDGTILEAAHDPRNASQGDPPSMRPHIFVNDGGWRLFGNFEPGLEPGTRLAANGLAHEMAHFLARFNSMTFGMDQPVDERRYYDESEHASVGTNGGRRCLLRSGGAGPPGPPPFGFYATSFPLFIPGSHDVPDTELYLIWNRIDQGRWLQAN